MPKDTPLDKLLKQQEELKAQIKEAKAKKRRLEMAEKKERCRIMGAALLDILEENSDLAAQIEPLIEDKVTKDKDRQILGLDPLPKPDDKPAVNE